MAEIAVISQDFCTLQELRSQDPPNQVIDYKSIAPITLVSYVIGNKNNEVVGGNISYNYSYGFLRKVGPTDTKVGNLRISQSAPDGSLSFPSAYLDMDNNRVINLGDSDEGNSTNPSGTGHHAINQRVGDRRYLRKENWAPEGERTMSNDLLFDGNYRIKRTTDQGTLTISGGYSSDKAIIKLDSASASITITTNNGTSNTGRVNINTAELFTTSTVTDIDANTSVSLRSDGEVNVISPTANFSGNILLNSNKRRRIQNVASRTWAQIEPENDNEYDNDAVNYKSFKNLQRGSNIAGNDNNTTQAYNVYVDTQNGVHRFRRIVGGRNIRARLVGNDIYIDNVAPLTVTISRKGRLANGRPPWGTFDNNITPTSTAVLSYLNLLFPPNNFDVGTVLRVSFESHDSGNVGPVNASVSENFDVSLTWSISRLTGARLTGGITGVNVAVPSSSQPVLSVPIRDVHHYSNNGSSWEHNYFVDSSAPIGA